MSKWEQLHREILSGDKDASIPFEDLCGLLKRCGFETRTKGSHHIFRKNGVLYSSTSNLRIPARDFSHLSLPARDEWGEPERGVAKRTNLLSPALLLQLRWKRVRRVFRKLDDAWYRAAKPSEGWQTRQTLPSPPSS